LTIGHAATRVDTPVPRTDEYWNRVPEINGIAYRLRRNTHMASRWADEFIPVVESVWSPSASGHGYFKGTSACLSALFAAGRYDELLALIDKARFKWWHNRRWGVKALAAMGKKAEAIRYAEDSRGLNDPGWQIAESCEAILLSSGLADEAYRRYAIEANQGTTNLATFRAIAKKYNHVPPEQILQDLVASTPGTEGKWFAAAKEAGLFSLAAELANTSPTDPRTLTRAARDFASDQPQFAINAALSALRWIARDHGYEITGADILDTANALQQASTRAGMNQQNLSALLAPILAEAPPRHLLHQVLSPFAKV